MRLAERCHEYQHRPLRHVAGAQITDFYMDGSGKLYYFDIGDNNEGSNIRVVKVNIFTGVGNGTVLADKPD